MILYCVSTRSPKATDFILNIRNEEKEPEVQQPLKSSEREKELAETRRQTRGISRDRVTKTSKTDFISTKF